MLPNYSWKNYDEIIEKMGRNVDSMKINVNNFEFKMMDLIYIGVVDVKMEKIGEEHAKLSAAGKEYFLKKYCNNQEFEADEIIRKLLEKSAPVRLLIQVFWGQKRISKENIQKLLAHRGLIDSDANIGNFLAILNKFRIITYDKKNNSIKIIAEPYEIEEKKDYFVDKTKPYSNMLKLKKMIQESKQYIYWFEKHFSIKIYEYLSVNTDGSKIKEVRILTGPEHIDLTTRDEFKRLQEELLNKKIDIRHRIILNKDLLNSIHGRWFLTSDVKYKIPPINTLLQGQTDEIQTTTQDPPFEEWWGKSVDLIKDWDKIEKVLKEKSEKDGRK
jgi:hypothetical protein